MDITQLDFKQIAIWVVIWLVGYALGLFEAWFKNKNKKEEKPEPEIIQAPPQLIEEDYALAIFEKDNDLSLKLDKSELTSPTSLDSAQRKRLISLVVKLRPWLEGKATAPKTKPQRPAAQPQPAQPKPTPRPAVPPPSIPVAQSASTDVGSQPLSADELEYSKLNMAGQINWILQKNLEDHPLKARNIRLENALTGGVVFRIGDESYEYVDEIPYPEIQALFKEASAEWEKRSTPGL